MLNEHEAHENNMNNVKRMYAESKIQEAIEKKGQEELKMNFTTSLDMIKMKMDDYNKMKEFQEKRRKECLAAIQEQCPHIYVEHLASWNNYTMCALCEKLKTSE